MLRATFNLLVTFAEVPEATSACAMLTRGRAAQARVSPDTVLSPLPRCFVHAVFLRLPVDARLRCAEVSRAWRALLADTTLWSSLALSLDSGLTRFSQPLFRAAVVKAGGKQRTLDVLGVHIYGEIDDETEDDNNEPLNALSFGVLRAAVAFNSSTLVELRTCSRGHRFLVPKVRLLLEDAPLLQLLELNLCFDGQPARDILLKEPLRIQSILVAGDPPIFNHPPVPPVDVFTLCADLRNLGSLQSLTLSCVDVNTAASMVALVDAAIALRLGVLRLYDCATGSETLPALTRCVSSGAARKLVVFTDDDLFVDFQATHQFCAAVHISSLQRLEFCEGMGVTAAVELVVAVIKDRGV